MLDELDLNPGRVFAIREDLMALDALAAGVA